MINRFSLRIEHYSTLKEKQMSSLRKFLILYLFTLVTYAFLNSQAKADQWKCYYQDIFGTTRIGLELDESPLSGKKGTLTLYGDVAQSFASQLNLKNIDGIPFYEPEKETKEKYSYHLHLDGGYSLQFLSSKKGKMKLKLTTPEDLEALTPASPSEWHFQKGFCFKLNK